MKDLDIASLGLVLINLVSFIVLDLISHIFKRKKTLRTLKINENGISNRCVRAVCSFLQRRPGISAHRGT